MNEYDFNELSHKTGLCQQCAHEFDPHVLVCSTEDPLDGGIMVCPSSGCQCYSTWGVAGDKEPHEVPDRAQLELIREQFQAEH